MLLGLMNKSLVWLNLDKRRRGAPIRVEAFNISRARLVASLIVYHTRRDDQPLWHTIRQYHA